MSELIQKNDNRATIRWKLLTSVSAAALLVSVYAAGEARAGGSDADRPLVWIELGGQLERLGDSQEAFSPPFMASITQANLLSAMNVQKPPAYAIGEEGKISFQPENSDWVFSASIRYGRSAAKQHGHQQTPNGKVILNVVLPPPYRTAFHSYKPIKYGSYYPNHHVKFADGAAAQSETHAILDFQAGKDVGLGMFGGRGSSVLSAGVRIAQFRSKTNVNLHAEPDVHYPTAPITGTLFTALPKLQAFRYPSIHFHDYAAMEANQRSFRGIGPSLAWNVSAPFAGNLGSGELTFDWGVNAAILFGRQKASGHHQTTVKSYYYNRWMLKGNGCRRPDACQKTGHFYNRTNFENGPGQGGRYADYTGIPTAQHTRAANFNRVRSLTVPNFGAFAGVSVRYSDVKISLGYRADFFFGAMDGGIDTRKSENRGFYGPFASVSVGLP